MSAPYTKHRLDRIDGSLVFTDGTRIGVPPGFILVTNPGGRSGAIGWSEGANVVGYDLAQGATLSSVRAKIYALARYAVKRLVGRGTRFNACHLARELGLSAAEVQRLGGGVRESQMLHATQRSYMD